MAKKSIKDKKSLAKARAKKKTPAAKIAVKRTAVDQVLAKPSTLNKFFKDLRNNERLALAAGAPKGACLISDPHTGTNHCILTDKTTCAGLKGTFLGGPCGG